MDSEQQYFVGCHLIYFNVKMHHFEIATTTGKLQRLVRHNNIKSVGPNLVLKPYHTYFMTNDPNKVSARGSRNLSCDQIPMGLQTVPPQFLCGVDVQVRLDPESAHAVNTCNNTYKNDSVGRRLTQ